MTTPERPSSSEQHDGSEEFDYFLHCLIQVLQKLESNPKHRAVTSYELILQKFTNEMAGQVKIEELLPFFDHTLDPKQQLSIAISKLNVKLARFGIEIRRVQAYEIVARSRDEE